MLKYSKYSVLSSSTVHSPQVQYTHTQQQTQQHLRHTHKKRNKLNDNKKHN